MKIMERCWEQDREKRIDIFTVVTFLRHLKIRAASVGEYIVPSDVYEKRIKRGLRAA